MTKTAKSGNTGHDQVFKTVIQEFFKEFMELFLPAEAKRIDFRKVEFLDKEHFTDLVKGRKRVLDLVAKVGLLAGGEEFVLVHVEFESMKPDAEFPERMFQYHCQLYLRHRKPIVPVVLFTDDAQWPLSELKTSFELSFEECVYNRFKYMAVKLRSLDHRKYLRSHNPLAYALMCKMDYDRGDMARLKADFLRMMLGCPINAARKSLLFEFMEQYMPLSGPKLAEFEIITKKDKSQYREVAKMVTVYEKRGIQKGRQEGRKELAKIATVYEKRGIQKGRQEGRQEGLLQGLQQDARESVLDNLQARFGKVPAQLAQRISKVDDLEKLRELRRKAATVGSIKEFKI